MPAAIPGYSEQFEAACRDGGSTFAAAGLNPNFIAERLGTTITGLCADVEAVTAQETYLCAEDNYTLVFESVGFGKPIEEWGAKDSVISAMFDHMFAQSVHNMANTLNVELADVTHSVDLVPADRDIVLPAGVVKKGTVAVITQTWHGIAKDPNQIRITVCVSWAVANDIAGHSLQSGWQVSGDRQAESCDEHARRSRGGPHVSPRDHGRVRDCRCPRSHEGRAGHAAAEDLRAVQAALPRRLRRLNAT